MCSCDNGTMVDGSNIVMRAAFGGDRPPAHSTPDATGLIRRVMLQCGGTHLVVALDSPAPSWRKLAYPDYKGQRTRDTSPWIKAAYEEWSRMRWYVEMMDGFEADDIIATLATRAHGRCEVVVVSSDSDLLSLTALNIPVCKPVDGGKFVTLTSADVCTKFKIAAVTQLTDYKALTGEAGDNIPGVPGVGPVRAAGLLDVYGGLEAIIEAGTQKKCPASIRVAEHAATARRAYKLCTLTCDAPVLAVKPSDCLWC